MGTAITVVAYALAGVLAIRFALLCWTLKKRKDEVDRKRAERIEEKMERANAEHEQRRSRIREAIDRGARRTGGRL